MVSRLKKISEETLHENPWWKYKHDVYEKPDGTKGDYFYAETPGMVLLVPVLEDGRIILVQQYRYLVGRTGIEFPGGGIKPGTELSRAAADELREETGCTASDLILAGTFEQAVGFGKDRAHVFVAHVDTIGHTDPDSSEAFELVYRHPDEVEDMIRRNDIWDAGTMAAWSLVRHHFV